MALKKVGAPRNNHNRLGKVKAKRRIQISMSISDCSEVSEGVVVDLRARFEDYLLAQGEHPTDDAIKTLARQWAYESWWFRLKRGEDEQAMIQ